MITTQELRPIFAFQEVEDGAIALTASRCADLRAAAGEWIINEGDVPRFFMVISGELEVSKRIGGMQITLTTYGENDSFGEVPLMLGSAAVASVRAKTAVRLAALEATDFWRLTQSQPAFAKVISANISKRLLYVWSTVMDAPMSRCGIIGDPKSPDCHKLRDFLTRLHIPFDWQERDSSQCDVVFADGRRLISPTLRELAQALDLRTRPRTHCYDVAIVGGGPAGLAAAVYGASEGLRTILIERDAPGGQAGMSSRIENYLGFPNGISGEDLADRAFRQAERFGADILVTREAVRIEGEPYDRRIILDGDEVIRCRSIVLATGVSYRSLSARGCDDFLNRGVFYGAAQAEARQVTGKHIHLLGGGNSAGQAAMYFSLYAQSVTIVIRASNLAKSMSQYLIDELRKQPNVSVITDSEVIAIEGSVEPEVLVLRSVTDGTERREATKGLFVFIGADARTAWLTDTIATDEQGFILTGSQGQHTDWPLERPPFILETSQPGIFAVGDVRKTSVKRVASGVGEGATAITMVHQILAEMNAAEGANQRVPEPTPT